VFAAKQDQLSKLLNDTLKTRQQDIKPMLIALHASSGQYHEEVHRNCEALAAALDGSKPQFTGGASFQNNVSSPTFSVGGGGFGSPQQQHFSNPLDRLIKPRGSYKTIVIGETGCGKSTLINTVCNLFRKGSLDNLKILIPTS
jgi:ribosome biogenesis GTPase A